MGEAFRRLTASEMMLKKASSYIGLTEVVGEDDNPIILDMFRNIGHSWVKSDETAWCSCFINHVAKSCGLRFSGKLDARSWLSVGVDITNPVVGDIVVFWRESRSSWKGHVGIFCGYDENGDILTLGGNQSNEVNITAYSKHRLLGFKRLS